MQNPIIFSLIVTFHNLFTAIWIGGMITLAVAYIPTILKTSESPSQIQAFIGAVQKRLRPLAITSIVGLIITGILLSRSNPLNLGFLNFTNAYSSLLSIKHVLMVVMVIIAVVRTWLIMRTMINNDLANHKFNFSLLVVNISLGISVLFLSGLLASFSMII